MKIFCALCLMTLKASMKQCAYLTHKGMKYINKRSLYTVLCCFRVLFHNIKICDVTVIISMCDWEMHSWWVSLETNKQTKYSCEIIIISTMEMFAYDYDYLYFPHCVIVCSSSCWEAELVSCHVDYYIKKATQTYETSKY